MLNFEPFSIETLKKAIPYIQRNTSMCSDHSIGAVFMWHSDDIRFCFWNNTFVIHQTVGSQSAFSWPVGDDVDGMIDELLEYARINRLPMRFYAVGEETLGYIKNDVRLQSPVWTYDTRWSDYIYSFEDAMLFKGRKFSGQRNHINKFKRLFGEPVVRIMNEDDIPAVKAMLAKYEEDHTFKNKMERLEFNHTCKLIDYYSELGLVGACLTVGAEIAAFSIGEIIGEMLVIHVEKALAKYTGAYPTMYNGFVQLIAELKGYPLRLVNREDDSGDEGLRISKEQYKPVGKVHKYLVHVNSPAAKIECIPVIYGDGVVITEFRDTDKYAYLELNTDVENNRFWGYDYREDAWITGHINEDTFYDFVMYDMKVCDSLNFAVRLNESGEMIGEGILWNFGADGSAELGCRLLPEYHGKGYGKKAFGAIADFAVNTLNLKLWARCYRQNEASAKMILANGFEKVKCDDTFFYFERINSK